MPEDTQVRVGIVGLGGIARHHADQLAALADDGVPVELTYGMDVDADARDSFAAAYDARTVADVDELYDAVDAVLVTTPNRFHEEYVVGALDAGRPVLVEKPLAHTLESAERIAAAADRSDAFCMVGFHNRFAPAVQALQPHLDAGRLGEIYHVEATHVRRRGVPGRGSWFTDKAAAGGGALVDIGSHSVDLALHLLDFPPITEVAGKTRSTFGSRDDYTYLEMWGPDGDGDFDVDDAAHAFLRCADGRTIALEVAWATNRPSTNELGLHGTDAGATIDLTADTLTLHEVDDGDDEDAPAGEHADERVQFVDTTVTSRGAPAHRAEKRTFLEAVGRGEVPRTNTVEQALAVQRVLAAIYDSADTGAAVELDEWTGAGVDGDR